VHTEGGGVLVVTARSAARTRDNQTIAQAPPGLLADLCGMSVEESARLEAGSLAFRLWNCDVPCGAGYEILKAHGAEVIAAWKAPADQPPCAAAGEPAVTAHKVARGCVIYVGTYLSDENAPMILDLALSYARIEPLAQAPEAVEVTRRRHVDRQLTFVLNHYPQPQKITRLPKGVDLLSQRPCDGEMELGPYGVAVIE